MSVPSSNVATTCDRPNFETERTCSSPFRPPTACSTGKVICRSTSSGASSGALALICTWTGVVSGKASSGRWIAARTPSATRMPPRSRITNRFFRLKSIVALSMGKRLRSFAGVVDLLAAPGADGALHDLGLQQEGPLGDDPLARLQPPGDLDHVVPVRRPGDDPLG